VNLLASQLRDFSLWQTNMKVNILLGGKAGQGIAELALFVAEVLVKQGYYVFNYRDYQSLIRGGHSFNVVSVSEKPVHIHDLDYDVIVAVDENTIDVHKSNLKKEGKVLSEKEVKALGIVRKNKLDIRVVNIVYAATLLKMLGVDKKIIIDEINSRFKGKSLLNDDLKAAEFGYMNNLGKVKMPKVKPVKRYFMNGSEGIGIGAISSGLDVYLSYPMTPSTGVLHYLAKKQLDYNYIVMHPENEIAVANAALGSSHVGARTMIGTAGGGYDLMTEAMSMQGMAQIPLTVYLSQRPGPGTGVPTYSSQGDLNLALKSSHGEFPRVVVAPGDPIECIELTNQAMYLAEKFRILSILLGDKHVAESEYTFDSIPNILKIESSIDTKKYGDKLYPNYLNEKRSVPGLSLVRSTSYEHNEMGYTVEDAKTTKKMAEKRLEIMKNMKKEIKKFERIKVFGKKSSDKVVISWGSTKGAILDAANELKNWKFVQVLYLGPFPADLVSKELNGAKKIVLVEENLTGLMGDLLKEKTGIEVTDKVLKYDSRVFTKNELVEKLSKI